MKKNIYAVIMAGGKGERFWPLSTSRHPKQFLSLIGGKPMLTMAVERLKGLIPPERTIIITNADLVKATAKAVPQVPAGNIIGEPFGRDTAAACALAMALVKARHPDGAFCILTADHIIGDRPVFRSTLRAAFRMALSEDVLVTIGIKPVFPSTGFGYIEAQKKSFTRDGISFRKARRFVEKPDLATAKKYVTSGQFFWNSGMFIWSVSALDAALARFSPKLHQMACVMQPVAGKSRFQAVLKSEYQKLDRISIDYAIMEKAENIVMAESAFAWDDAGSWPALQNHFDADPTGNIRIGDCEILESKDNIVVSGDRLTALIGVSDLMVIQAKGVTLVCPKSRAQDIKNLVRQLASDRKHKKLL